LVITILIPVHCTTPGGAGCRRAPCAECRGADVERCSRYVVQVQRRCRDAEVLVQRDNNKKLVRGFDARRSKHHDVKRARRGVLMQMQEEGGTAENQARNPLSSATSTITTTTRGVVVGVTKQQEHQQTRLITTLTASRTTTTL
jgi:hypothetical protein